LSSILYYITGHGYGHAVRSSQVIGGLKAARADLTVHVRTTAPEWLFPTTVRCSRQSIDAGIVQRDSLTMDLEATIGACRSLQDNAARTIENELAFIRAHDVRLIVGDIPPLCFEIAARAAIPSVAVTNFTWDGIYGAYLEAHPNFAPLIDQMAKWYARTTLALILPYPCNMDAFPRREPIPWLTRVSTLEKEAARKQFGLPAVGTIVLLSFGGLGLQHLPWGELKRLRDYVFVTTADERKIDGNVVIVTELADHSLKRQFQKERAKGRGVQTALRVDRSPVKWILVNGKAPPVLPTSDGLFLNVEPLSEVSTPHGKGASRRAGVGWVRRATFSASC
jgi:hypothetical protein